MRDRCHSPCSRAAASANGGFTLIELMVALIVAGILVAVAYPAYTSYVTKSRREDARATLAAIVQAQERMRSNAPSYQSDPALLTGQAAGSTVLSAKGYYTISVTDASATGYQVNATPVASGPQANDAQCAVIFVLVTNGNLRYGDSLSTPPAVSPCWPQ